MTLLNKLTINKSKFNLSSNTLASSLRLPMNPDLLDSGLIDTYIKSTECDCTNCLYLVFDKICGSPTVDTMLQKHSKFKNIYVYPTVSVYEFSLPEEFKEDLTRFKEGQFSKFSAELKDLITSGHSEYKRTAQGNARHFLWTMVYPREFEKKHLALELGVDFEIISELCPRPDMERETFNPNKF